MSYSIPKISNSDIANEVTFNTPIEAVETALNDLEGRINNITNKEAILVSGVSVSSDTDVGDLVYKDSDSGMFKPALAELAAVPGSTGASLEAPCARVVGMVVSKSGGSATLLIGGRYDSTTCAEACLGENATPGTYYLSPMFPGKATKDPGAALRQPLLTYWGNGVFSLGLFYMAHDNHYHASVNLTAGWSEASNFPTMDVPAGYSYGYNIYSDSSLMALGDLSANSVSIFVDGKLDGRFKVTSENIWTNSPESLGSSDIVLFTFFPFVYNSPVVRGIVSGSENITVTSVNGIVTISSGGYMAGDVTPSNTAVSGISGKYINKTPVISGITTIGGITAVVNGLGQAIISSTDLMNCPVPAMEFNMNGTKRVSDSLFTYVVFPRSVSSSVTMSYMMSTAPGSGSFRFKVWMQTASGTGSLVVKTYFMPLGSSSDSTKQLIGVGDILSTETINVSSDGQNAVYYETSVGAMADQDGSGLLMATITTGETTPASDIRLLGAGFMVVEPSNAKTASMDALYSVSCITGVGIAGSYIEPGQLLAMLTPDSSSSDEDTMPVLVLASANLSYTKGTLVGVATEYAAAGHKVTYVSSGACSVPYTVDPGKLLFVGAASGTITTQPPNVADGAYIQRVGWALTKNKILVDIEATIEDSEDESSSISL